jgi:predicted glycoside hydrolase/deacetylase ChbG (UPF0249 family)
MTRGRTLCEELGYPADAKLLIVNCDDLGSSRGANTAIFEALRSGTASSASLMVPCPDAQDAARSCETDDVGVHLTLNCEIPEPRWGPLTEAPSLLADDGSLASHPADVIRTVDRSEVRDECRAQIEQALQWGVDITHLDSHRNALVYRRDLAHVYLELGIEYDVPLRALSRVRVWRVGRRPVAKWRFEAPQGRSATTAGVVCPDRMFFLPMGGRGKLMEVLNALQPGVTEVCLHPAVETDELRSSDPEWERRVDDYQLLCTDPSLAERFEQAGATLIGYRELRDLQRSRRSR